MNLHLTKTQKKLLDEKREVQRAWYLAATETARATIKPGDRISRTMCAGLRGTFTFTHWEGDWLCGKTVSDCHAVHIYKVNGKPTQFANGARP